MGKAINIKSFDGMNVDIKLKSRRTILSGDSGTGKTFLYSILDNHNLVDNEDKIKCIDIDNVDRSNPQLTVEILKPLVDHVIVIDQADEVLDYPVIYDHVMYDTKNYYILMGRKCSSYITELADLEIKGNHIGIEYFVE